MADTNEKFRVVFSDGKEAIKTRWDIAIFSKDYPNRFSEDKWGIIHYKGQDYTFIAFPIKECKLCKKEFDTKNMIVLNSKFCCFDCERKWDKIKSDVSVLINEYCKCDYSKEEINKCLVHLGYNLDVLKKMFTGGEE